MNKNTPIGRRGSLSRASLHMSSAMKGGTLPQPLKFNDVVVNWSYFETIKGDKIADVCVKHVANTRSTEDLNARNLSDLEDLDIQQREYCYAQLVDGKLHVLEGWRRTNQAILKQCDLTYLVTEDELNYANWLKVVKKLSEKKPHSPRDQGIFYLNYMREHDVNISVCSDVHQISEKTIKRYIIIAKLSRTWLDIIFDFGTLSHSDFALLKKVENYFSATVKNSTPGFYKKDKATQIKLVHEAIEAGIIDLVNLCSGSEILDKDSSEKLKFINEIFFPVIPREKNIISILKVDKNQYVSKEVKGDVTTFRLSQMPNELLDKIELLIIDFNKVH